MENNCAFSKNHTCLKWIDYQLTRHELEEAKPCATETGLKFKDFTKK